MMLQVRNWSKSPISILQSTIILAVLLFVAGCKGEEQPVDPYVTPGTTENPQWVITVDTTDLTTSMTAIVRVDFAKSEGTLAAFMGDDCCGIAECIDSLYWLYISPSQTENDVRLKFYSPELKRIFVAKETFPFVNDDHQGYVDTPYTPTWDVEE